MPPLENQGIVIASINEMLPTPNQSGKTVE